MIQVQTPSVHVNGTDLNYVEQGAGDAVVFVQGGVEYIESLRTRSRRLDSHHHHPHHCLGIMLATSQSLHLSICQPLHFSSSPSWPERRRCLLSLSPARST
jgi:hypothetical protein